jgi:hypothetical protein
LGGTTAALFTMVSDVEAEASASLAPLPTARSVTSYLF